MVTIQDIRQAIHSLNLSNRPVCIHASLRSFGWVEGGPRALIDGFLAEGCTIVVPTFAYHICIPPPKNMRPPRNGFDYDSIDESAPRDSTIYTPESTELSRKHMGAVPAAVLEMDGHVRGNHPCNSFTAVGPLAHALISTQQPMNVYGPLEALAEMSGAVVLMGVGLNKMTLIHLAEQMAGRTLFRRWANGPDGEPMMVTVGSCSRGFESLAPHLAPVVTETNVGQSTWRVFPVQETLEIAARAIRTHPKMTHCGDETCLRCRDAVLGGPTLDKVENVKRKP